MRFLLFLLFLIPSSCWSMSTTFLKPSTNFAKPRFSTPGLTSFECQVVRSTAKQSFNEFERKVPLLAFHGAEDLLNKFIDPTLAYNNTDKVGQALFDGTLKIHEYSLSFDKNFNSGIFFSFLTTITSAWLKNITINPVDKQGQLLTIAEIEENTALTNYLKTFNKKILGGSCLFDTQNIGPSFVTIGWTKSFQDFQKIDFINFAIKAGLAIPEFDLNEEEETNKNPFSLPNHKRFNFGFPIQASVELGVFDWLNFGTSIIAIPFVSNDKIVKLNPTKTNNILLSNDKIMANIHHQPFVYVNAYIEAEELIPKLSWLIGFAYAKQFDTTYIPHDEQKYPSDIVNIYSLHKSWEQATINFEGQIDFATEEDPYYPRLKFLYSKPVYGRSVYKSNTYAGIIAIEILYTF